jgi:hypothetical protein
MRKKEGKLQNIQRPGPKDGLPTNMKKEPV